MVGNLCSHYALLALVFPGDTFVYKKRDVKKSLKPRCNSNVYVKLERALYCKVLLSLRESTGNMFFFINIRGTLHKRQFDCKCLR